MVTLPKLRNILTATKNFKSEKIGILKKKSVRMYYALYHKCIVECFDMFIT